MTERNTPADCVFCDPDRLPAHTLWPGISYGLYRVFEPLKPVVPGHLLVVPVHHFDDALENPEIAASTMYVAAQVAARYESANIITSIGEPATQSVMHLHVHVVPRTEGDRLHLPWTDQHKPASRIPRAGSVQAIQVNNFVIHQPPPPPVIVPVPVYPRGRNTW